MRGARSRPATRLHPPALGLSLALSVVTAVAAAQSGSQSLPEPVPAPVGYPGDLAIVPGGKVRLGVSFKDIQRIAEEFGTRTEAVIDGNRRLMTREMGKHEVFMPSFLIGRHEVTNEQYASYVKRMWPKVRFPLDWWLEEDIKKHREDFYKQNEGKRGVSFVPQDYWAQNYKVLKWALPAGQEKYPVSYVSFYDAQEYCATYGLRLPYEFEWQYAAQGSNDKNDYLWGGKWDGKDSLELLGYRTLRDQKRRPVAEVRSSRSWIGIDDLAGNVWEWTGSPFLQHEGFRDEMKQLLIFLKKRNKQPEAEPLWAADKRIVKGGSYNSVSQAGIAFRCGTRMALSTNQTVEDLGFRVAKSLDPALDTSILWYRQDFVMNALGERVLDLPTTRDMRRFEKGGQANYEQLGIERWDLDGEIIKNYSMVSFIPVAELKYKAEKDLVKAASEDDKAGAHGVPIGAVFTTVPFRVQQDINKFADVNPDMYVVAFRGKGLPRELELALAAGATELKANKGVRKGVPEAPKNGDAKPEGEKKNGDKTDDGKKDEGKQDEGKKDKSKKQEPQHAGNWYEIVDRYGVPDEITAKYPSKEPDTILLRPGNLEIPVKRNVLLYRKHDGDYVAWAEYREVVRKANAKSTAPKLNIDPKNNRLEYRGGPRQPGTGNRFYFEIEIRLPDGELNKSWITPDTNKDIEKRVQELIRVQASPTKTSGGNGNGDSPK